MAPGHSLDGGTRRPVCNEAVENFLRQQRREIHRRNVSESRTKVVNTWSQREEDRIAASRRNAKREQMADERYSNIEKENMRLLMRMQDIETRTPAKAAAMLSLGTSQVRSSSSLPPPGAGSRTTTRVREQKRIDFENQRMLKRLQTAKSSVDIKRSEADHAKQQRIMRMRMENPNEERLAEVRQANRALLPPRMPTPDPTHDDECDRLIQLRNQLLARAGLDVPKDDASENGESELPDTLRRSRSCDVNLLGSRAGSRPGSRSGSRIGSRPGTAGSAGAGGCEQEASGVPAPAPASPLAAIYSAGVIPEKSRAITEALMAEHYREVKSSDDAEAEAEEAKEAAAKALREANAIDISSISLTSPKGRDVADDYLSYGNIIQRGQAVLGTFDA